MLGEKRVKKMPPVMGGEDFSLFGRTKHQVPICMYWLGTVDPAAVQKSRKEGKPLPSLHSPFFAPDPSPTIRTGVRTMVAAVMDLMPVK